MAKENKLTRKQLMVLDEIFLGELNEQQVLDKYNVNRSRYYKWLADEVFAEQYDRRVAASYRQGTALLARYATLAAAKLVQLTESENQETARKVCLDIISMQGKTSDPGPKAEDSGSANLASPLSPEAASKILEVLAQQQKTEDR